MSKYNYTNRAMTGILNFMLVFGPMLPALFAGLLAAQEHFALETHLPWNGYRAEAIQMGPSTATLALAVISNEKPSGSGCTAPASTATISTDDSYMTLWFSYRNTKAGDTLVTQWYRPDGTLHGATDPSRVPGPGSYCHYNYWELDSSYTRYVGQWRIRVLYNNTAFFERNFTLIASSKRKPPVLNSVLLSKSGGGQGCQPPTPVVSFLSTDPTLTVAETVRTVEFSRGRERFCGMD